MRKQFFLYAFLLKCFESFRLYSHPEPGLMNLSHKILKRLSYLSLLLLSSYQTNYRGFAVSKSVKLVLAHRACYLALLYNSTGWLSISICPLPSVFPSALKMFFYFFVCTNSSLKYDSVICLFILLSHHIFCFVFSIAL